MKKLYCIKIKVPVGNCWATDWTGWMATLRKDAKRFKTRKEAEIYMKYRYIDMDYRIEIY